MLRTHGRAVYLPATSTLVVADLHVGRAAASNVGLLLDERADLRDRLGAILAATNPETVVFAGDVLHRFGAPRPRTVGTVRALAGRVRAAGARPVAVAGNHDGGLDDAWPGTVHDAYRLSDGTVVCHGHARPETDGERYVCGHVHPSLTVEGRKRDCFLRTAAGYRDRPVLVVPAFSTLAAGVRIERRAGVDSPLVTDLDTLRPGVIEEAPSTAGDRTTAGGDGPSGSLWFPPLGDLRPHLRR
ncbi:metallophosphoesterase [Haloplanus pelagicus]|jgi:metallophosphoesterase superfamily enzyme|uniref:metallophosphoesterase n=1 Tax=Haloplanus pelagicus TaxID=2949995 RepID=UPI00203ABA18|nr:metallophosphoesterase [Haloplanus sp. HW8-1]